MIYEDIAIEIGKKIKEKRIEKNLTLEEVGTMIGVTKATMLKYETGAIKKISNERLKALAAVLNISHLELVPTYWLSKNAFNSKLENKEILKSDISKVYGDDILKLLEKALPLSKEGILKLIDRADELLEVPKYNQSYLETSQDNPDYK